MATIAHTLSAGTPVLDQLRQALPGTHLVYARMEALPELLRHDPPHAVLVHADAPSQKLLALVAQLKARHPWLITLALIDRVTNLTRVGFDLAKAGVDELVVAGFDDHHAVRTVLDRAAIRAAATALADVCYPLPPPLIGPTLWHVLEHIASIRRAAQLAVAAGVSARILQEEFRRAGLVPPQQFVGWLRIVRAAERFSWEPGSAERVGVKLGYASASAFRKACRILLSATPGDVRSGGGLRFAHSARRRRRASA